MASITEQSPTTHNSCVSADTSRYKHSILPSSENGISQFTTWIRPYNVLN